MRDFFVERPVADEKFKIGEQVHEDLWVYILERQTRTELKMHISDLNNLKLAISISELSKLVFFTSREVSVPKNK